MSATSWRQREIEKARLRKEAATRAEEEARIKSIQKTETNFPSMLPPQWGGAPGTAFNGTSFSSMAQKWATDEKIEKTLEEYRAQKAAKAERDNAVHGVVLMPTRRRPLAEIEEDEDEAPTRPPSEDDWTEVRNHKIKVKRELTTAELERKAREVSDDEDDDRNDEDNGTYGRPRSDW